MKTAKKLLSLLLALAMIFNLGIPALAAEGDPTFSMAVDQTQVAPGDTVTLTVSLDKQVTAVTLLSMKIKVLLDGNDVGTDVTLSSKTSAYGITDNLSKTGISNISITYLDMLNNEDFDMDAGDVAVLQFTAAKAGTLSFAMTVCELTETYYDTTGVYTGQGMKSVNFDSTPITVTVAEAESEEGVQIPEGAPFTAITTDAGDVLAITGKEPVSYNGYSTYTDIPLYHVAIPVGATTVSVTHPSAQDPFADASYGKAYGYYAETEGWTGGGMEFDFEAAEDGYIIVLPLSASVSDWTTGETSELSFVAGEDGVVTHAVAVERNTYDPICFFTFEYMEEATEHTCVFEEEVAEEKYLKSAADCTNAAVYYHSCTCGETGTTTFTYGEALGHSYTDGTCTVCGEADPDYTQSVTELVLSETELTLTEGGSATLTATVVPADAVVEWSSSDDTVATVSGGTVTAVGAGQAVITATAGELQAQCTVTVEAAIQEPGYTVKMPDDIRVTAGDAISIAVTVGHTDGATGYNAFDMQFAYDAQALELTSTEISGMTVTVADGTIRVQGYGDDRAVDTAPFSLSFKALTASESSVLLTSAKVDNSGNAVAEDAPEAIELDGETVITVTGFTVTLPEGFEGENVAAPGEDYTFTQPDDLYDYPDVQATVDGSTVPVTDNGDGTYTIGAEYITGNITVTSGKVGKTFSVTLPDEMEGEPTAQYMAPEGYTATLVPETGYTYTVSVTVGGNPYTGYSTSGNDYIIPGGDITGDIVFTVTKTSTGGGGGETTYHTVTFTGTGSGAAEGNATSVADGGTYTLTLTKETGYTYTVSAVDAAGQAVTVTEGADGTYTVANVTSNLTFTVDKTLDVEVAIYEYVTLDGNVMFLVLAEGELASGNVYAYDGKAMVYSEVYDAWAYLTIEASSFAVEDAKVLVSAISGTTVNVESADYDVNDTGLVDINDAQLVYDIYNGKYESFDSLTMTKFLWADVNASRNVTVEDAAAIVSNIQ